MRTRTIMSVASLLGLSLVGSAQGAAGTGGGGTTIPQPPVEHSRVVHHYGPGANPNAVGPFTCETPATLTLCNNASYQQCAGAEGKCKPIVEAAGVAHASGSSPTCLMDATGDHCIPTAVKNQSSAYKKNEGTSWAAQEAAAMRDARVKFEGPLRAGVTAANHSRNPKWASRTSDVDSCESYVYSKYYDYERFLDASYACGTDDQCVFDVAFKDYTNPAAGAPRIAKRNLLDREGAPIAPSSSYESNEAKFQSSSSDLLPKNGFHSAAAFIPPAVFTALAAAWANDSTMVSKLEALKTKLAKGYNFYTYGNYGQPAVDYHATVWDWHQAMNGRTKVSPYPYAQQLEMRARNENINGSVWSLASMLACLSMSMPCAVVPYQVARVTPGMAESYPADRFGMAGLMTKNDRFSAALQGAFESSFVPSQIPAGGIDINIGQFGMPGFQTAGAKVVPGTQSASALATGGGGTTTTTPPTTTTTPTTTLPGRTGPIVTSPLARKDWDGFPADYWTTINYTDQNQLQSASRILQVRWQQAAGYVDTARGEGKHPRLDCNAPSVLDDGILMAACEVTNNVLDEWARSFDGNASCLDANGYQCDWSPSDFRDSMLGSQRMQRSREMDYQECLYNTHNSFTTENAVGEVAKVHQTSWKTVKAYIDAIIDEREGFQKRVPKIERKSGDAFTGAIGTVYGDRAKDKQQWGNDVFGAGYSYTIGWDAAVLRRERLANQAPSEPAKGVINEMQLGFDGEFEAHASAFGNDIPLLEAQLGAHINYAGSGNVDAEHYLYIIGAGAFDGLETKGFHTVGTINHSLQIANPEKTIDENVFDAGFWIGPVYVHVGIDVVFFYGAPLDAEVKQPSKGVSLAPTPGRLLSGELTFHPKAGVNANLYAYGGWGPIAEVGLEAKLNLITVGLPMKSSIGVVARKGSNNTDVLFLTVHEGIEVSLETLSGQVDACGRIIGIGGCAKLFSWKGLHQRFPLFTAVDEEIELKVL